MERNKTIGLILGLLIALSGLGYIVYAPRTVSVHTGTYEGQTLGRIVSFIDQQWVLISPPDVNGLPVLQTNGQYVFISVGDVNKTLQMLKERGVDFFLRDAVVSINVDIGKKTELNVPAYILPYHSVGDVIPVQYHVEVTREGIYGYAQEVIQ